MALHGLIYELSVLAKAVHHKNLSAASVHIGLSQPQLSRLIAKIESELNVVLLDRTARRKSGWTPLAHEIALSFSRSMGRLQSEILSLAQESEPSELRIGTLEGLSNIAMAFSKSCIQNLEIKSVHLDVLDFKDLDSQFLNQNLDLIFTVKNPSKQKPQHVLEVGYQQIEKVQSNKDILVLSPYELAATDKKLIDSAKKLFVSNSLALRTKWLDEVGGSGNVPTDAKKGKGKGYYSIYLIGSDLLSPIVWKKIQELFP